MANPTSNVCRRCFKNDVEHRRKNQAFCGSCERQYYRKKNAYKAKGNTLTRQQFLLLFPPKDYQTSVGCNPHLSQPILEPLLGLFIYSKQMRDVIELVSAVAKQNTSVVITGETGVGKELIARLIHAVSDRSDKPFIVIDCTTLASELIESELFGHERGAFTGAHQRKQGMFEVADGGTVLLDEISELPLSLQGKLLRILENRSVRSLGSTTSRELDIRIIAATNKNLKEMVTMGTFRNDLYYRLHVYPLHIPALRERRDDIGVLALQYLTVLDPRAQFSDAAMDILQRYAWPGNIRELRNVVEFAKITAQGARIIEVFHLPHAILPE